MKKLENNILNEGKTIKFYVYSRTWARLKFKKMCFYVRGHRFKSRWGGICTPP